VKVIFYKKKSGQKDPKSTQKLFSQGVLTPGELLSVWIKRSRANVGENEAIRVLYVNAPQGNWQRAWMEGPGVFRKVISLHYHD
jgi:hypothetical protein